MSKSLGQIAHEAGERAGAWSLKWDDVPETQRGVWESLAAAVAARIQAFTLDRAALICHTIAEEARARGELWQADGATACRDELRKRARGT